MEYASVSSLSIAERERVYININKLDGNSQVNAQALAQRSGVEIAIYCY